MSDRETLESALLAVRWRQGDRTAFEALVRLWERPLFYYLRRLAPSEAVAWEMLQDTWLRVFRSLATVRDPHALPAFLYRTARNAALSRLRTGEFAPCENLSQSAAEDRSEDDPADWECAEQIHHALDQLPLPQREALTLFFLQDLSIKEVAELLGVPVGTVKSRLHYAKLALRKLLTQGDDDARSNH